MRLVKFGCLSAAIMLALAAPSLAQSSSQATGLKLSGDQPIQIESDKLEVREADSIAIFTGNVNVVQGTTQMKAGKMTVHYAKKAEGEKPTPATVAPQESSQIERMEIDGKVYVKSNTQVATGDRGTFDMASEVMVLTGKQVVLTDGPNVVVGCKLTVQMKTGQAKLDGCGSGTGRVKMLVTPKSN
jgi:lipopolysaccharide export system protein LptA